MINDAKMDLDAHARSREEVPTPRTKVEGGDFKPQSHEDNENFTTQRAISCHMNL